MKMNRRLLRIKLLSNRKKLLALFGAVFLVMLMKYSQSSNKNDKSVIEIAEIKQNENKPKRKPGELLEFQGTMMIKHGETWSAKPWQEIPTYLIHPVFISGLKGDLSVYFFTNEPPYFPERTESLRFLELSDPLPLLDIGANRGLVTLSASQMG